MPVLPAVGLAAVAAGPVSQLFSPAAPTSPVVAALSAKVGGASEQEQGGGGDRAGHSGDDAKHGRRPHRPIHRPGPHGTTTTIAPTTTVDPTTTTVDPTTTTVDPTTTTVHPTTTTVHPTTTTLAPTTTMAAPTTTMAAPTTTMAAPTTTTAAPTTTTTAAPKPDLTVTEAFTKLANGAPFALALTATNSSGATHVYTMAVELKGSQSLPGYANVNSDSTYNPRPANWSCSPSDYQNPTADNLFACTVTLTAGQSTTVMVTTGSTLPASAKGSTVTVITSVSAEDNAKKLPLPATVTATGTVG